MLPSPVFPRQTPRTPPRSNLSRNKDGKVVPVEVKAGKNLKSESLRTYITTPAFAPELAIRASLGKHGETPNACGTTCRLLDIPLFMLSAIEYFV